MFEDLVETSEARNYLKILAGRTHMMFTFALPCTGSINVIDHGDACMLVATEQYYNLKDIVK